MGNILKFSLWTGGLVALASLVLNIMLSAVYPAFETQELLGVVQGFGGLFPNPSHIVQTAGAIPVVFLDHWLFRSHGPTPGARDLFRLRRESMVPLWMSLGLLGIFSGPCSPQP